MFAVAGYAVALAAVLVSLSHMFEVAHLAGQSWRSFLLPVSVDGLALVSVMAVRRCRRQGITPDRLVVGSLVLSVAASLAANVIASDPSLVDVSHLRWVVGAWPPVAFLLAELVIKQWHRAGAGVQPRTSRPGASPNPTSKARGRHGLLRPLALPGAALASNTVGPGRAPNPTTRQETPAMAPSTTPPTTSPSGA